MATVGLICLSATTSISRSKAIAAARRRLASLTIARRKCITPFRRDCSAISGTASSKTSRKALGSIARTGRLSACYARTSTATAAPTSTSPMTPPLTYSGLTRETEVRSEEHTSELQSRLHLVCRLLLEKKNLSRALRHRRRSHARRCPHCVYIHTDCDG